MTSNSTPVPTVAFTIYGEKVEVTVDATGPLYKRGYRSHVIEAPLKETLAAAMIRCAGIHHHMKIPKDFCFWDPMCGSGTIVLEASLTAHQRPAIPYPECEQTHDFPFKHFPLHDLHNYHQFLVQHCSINSSIPETLATSHFVGSDFNPKAILAAKHNATQAHAEHLCSFYEGDFLEVSSRIPQGAIVVTNLPYGQRSSGNSAVKFRELLSRFGQLLNKRPDFQAVYVLNGISVNKLRRVTQCKWKSLVTFDNNGIPVQLLQLVR